MVVGTGLLAKALDVIDQDQFIMMASGVSNSEETQQSEFERERTLVRDLSTTYSDKVLLYFSTCSIYDNAVKDRPYVRHKLAMERLVKKHIGGYQIFRLSNLVGAEGNSHTIFNYIYDHVVSQKSFQLWKNSTRNLIDVDHAVQLISIVLHTGIRNEVINIANQVSFPMSMILSEIENHVGLRANVEIVNKGEKVEIDTSYIDGLLSNVSFREINTTNYLKFLLKKYH